jgi:hypothetical protein
MNVVVQCHALFHCIQNKPYFWRDVEGYCFRVLRRLGIKRLIDAGFNIEEMVGYSGDQHLKYLFPRVSMVEDDDDPELDRLRSEMTELLPSKSRYTVNDLKECRTSSKGATGSATNKAKTKLMRRVKSEFAGINAAGSTRMGELDEKFKEMRAKYESDKILEADR